MITRGLRVQREKWLLKARIEAMEMALKLLDDQVQHTNQVMTNIIKNNGTAADDHGH